MKLNNIKPRPLRFLSLATAWLIILISAAAADQLTAPVLVTASDADGSTLGIPRWKGYMSELNTNEFWLSYASAGTSDGSMNYTTDAGATWSTSVIQIAANGWLDFHLSLFGRNGELFFTWPGVGFRKFNAPAHSNTDRDPLVTLSGTSGAHRSNIMVQNTGRIWIFTRDGDNAAENVKYQYSDNDGLNWTAGTAYATGAPNVRICSSPYVGGSPALVVLHLSDPRGFEYYLWNGSTFEAKSDHSMYAYNFGYTRAFTHNVINDTTMHLIFGNDNSLHHVWKNYNNGTGTWNHAIIDNSSFTVDNDWYPISTVKGNDLYVFYCRKSSSDASTSMIYYQKWSQVSQSWTAPILVSTDAANVSNRDPNTCFKVPTNATYVPVFWWCGTAPYKIYFAKILTGTPSGDTIPPGKILDLGAAPGSQTGEARLSWTATGDDDYTGTASSYSIRYSLTPLNDINWFSAPVVSNPPVPKSSGNAESLLLTGLQSGETYYFGIRVYDDAFNDSPTSNIANIELSLDITDSDEILPSASRLKGTHPNPFNAATVIEYQVASLALVNLSIYNTLGEKVRTLVEGMRSHGDYAAIWNGTDSRGKSVATGVYLCRLDVDAFSQSQRVVLLK